LSVKDVKENVFTGYALVVLLAGEIEDLIVLADVKQQFHFDAISMWLHEHRLVNSKDIVAIVGVVVGLFTPERN